MADLSGRLSAQEKVDRFAEVEVLAPPEALAYFKKKLAMTRGEFDALDGAYRDVAFTVARVDSLRALGAIKTALTDAIAQGTTMRTFAGTIDAIMDKEGLTALNPLHVETVFRTNTASAFMAGRLSIFSHVDPKEFPLFEYNAILDDRVRQAHARLDGVRMPLAEFIAQHLVPPLGYNCRCSLSPVHVSEGLAAEPAPEGDQAVTASAGFGLPVNPKRLLGLVKEAFPELAAAVSPKTMEGLRDTLRTYQAMKETQGVAVSPIRKVAGDLESDFEFGQFYQDTGELELNKVLWPHLETLLSKGKIETADEVQAWFSFTHEIGHSVGPKLDMVKYSVNKMNNPYTLMVETVNELWAQLNFREMAYRVGLDPGDIGIALSVFERKAYPLAKELISICEAAGMNRGAFRDMIERINLTGDPEEYEGLLYQSLADYLGVTLQDFGGLWRLWQAIGKEEAIPEWKKRMAALRKKARLPVGVIRNP